MFSFPVAQTVRICLPCRQPGFNPWVGKISWRKEWQPTPVFLPGEFHGQRILAGYSPWGRKESDMTEQLTLSFIYIYIYIHTHTHIDTHTHTQILSCNKSIIFNCLIDSIFWGSFGESAVDYTADKRTKISDETWRSARERQGQTEWGRRKREKWLDLDRFCS